MSEPIVERKDVETALEARRELGPEYERQVIDSFVDRIERRVDERLAEMRPRRQGPRPVPLVLPLGSLGIGIGVTGAALGPTNGGAGGVLVAIVAWIAIALVNIAYAVSRR
jgi:hypothetical protein